PQHFAEVRADLGVGPPAIGAAQLLRRALQIALAVKHPAQAVDGEIVLRRELERFFAQLSGLGQPRVALGERVAERVVGVRVLGLHLDQLAQVRFHLLVALELLGGQRHVVEQVGLLGILLERLAEQLEGVAAVVRLAQQLRLGHDQLHFLVGVVLGRALQVGARLVEPSLLGDRARGAQARGDHLLAADDLLVPFDGARPGLLLLGDLAQQVAHAVRVAIAQAEQPLHVLLGDRVVLELVGEQADRVDDVGVPGIRDRKSTRLNSSHVSISYAVFCLKKKKKKKAITTTQNKNNSNKMRESYNRRHKCSTTNTLGSTSPAIAQKGTLCEKKYT